jgi:TolB-like protein/Tfp pilus assembly protein PilF
MTERETTTVDAGVPPETAQAMLKKVLASPHFANARRLSEFLRFITLKAAAGETAQVDEYLIASEIYGRNPDYDPKVDSIVQVEANRLRAKLRDYYEAEGRGDPVRIRLPLDSYTPVWEAAQPDPDADSPATAPRRTPLRLTLAVTLAAVTTMAALVPFSRRASDPRNSIAVLPFANEGGAPEKDYFSDGLTEQIANRLGRSGKLRVAARTSAQRFKNHVGDARRIGQQLHVDLVLEGSVRFAGDRIGVSTQLYNTHNGRQIWSSVFNQPATGAPALQDEISAALGGALRLGNASFAREHAAMGWTNDSGALDLYLQARYLFNSRGSANLWKSLQLYNAALTKDPKFALAYAGIADDYVVLAANEDQNMSQMTALGRQAVEHALAIDPTLPEGLLTKAATEDHADFANVERSYRAALAANPNNANAHHWWGMNLLAAGRFAEAEAEIRQAQLLDPLALYISVHLGTVYYCSHRYQDTIDLERRLLDLDAHLARAPVLLARGYEGLGRYAEAEATLENMPKNDNTASVMADLGHVYAVSGKRDRARRVMDALTRMAKTRHVPPQDLALIQTGLGNKSEALALLEMSYEQHEAALALLKVDPRWDPLRGDPRFQQLLRGLSLDK